MNRTELEYHLNRIAEAFEKDHLDTEAQAVREAMELTDVIRCKDCAKRKYCRTSTVWAVAPSDDWYCADAERRTDG